MVPQLAVSIFCQAVVFEHEVPIHIDSLDGTGVSKGRALLVLIELWILLINFEKLKKNS